MGLRGPLFQPFLLEVLFNDLALLAGVEFASDGGMADKTLWDMVAHRWKLLFNWTRTQMLFPLYL